MAKGKKQKGSGAAARLASASSANDSASAGGIASAWPEGDDILCTIVETFTVKNEEGDDLPRVKVLHLSVDPDSDDFVRDGEPVDLPASSVLVREIEEQKLVGEIVLIRYNGKRTSARGREYHAFAVSKV